jgi:hypothetical protein
MTLGDASTPGIVSTLVPNPPPPVCGIGQTPNLNSDNTWSCNYSFVSLFTIPSQVLGKISPALEQQMTSGDFNFSSLFVSAGVWILGLALVMQLGGKK